MQFLICTVDTVPCPSESLSYLSMAEALNPAILGITPGEITLIYGVGVASVILFWFIGWVAGLAIDVIKQF